VQKTFTTATTLIAACTLAFVPPSSLRDAEASGTADGLTGASQLSSIYDTILEARFDQARERLAGACPPGPVAACDALREVALWWEIQLDLPNRTLDDRLEDAAKRAIASATDWTQREPARGEAWFYVAGAHAPLAQWRVLRGERLAAARDGKQIKDALERALALDNRLQDAWFGIGLYHYYADVAPAALKFLRVLLLLPGGDRVQGMQEMLRARERGELLRGEADYQMHWLYLWYEKQPIRALDLLRGLDARYSGNPLFSERIAAVQHEYFSDHRASAATWQSLLDRTEQGRVSFGTPSAARARVGLASELIELSQPARAIEVLNPVIAMHPAAPYGIVALAQLTMGDALARAGDRDRAAAAYANAIANAPRDDPDAIRARARAAVARVRSAR
jgi:tetratricopeptide (TPR) repeat protein